MTRCPIALAVGWKKCPAFVICPVKGTRRLQAAGDAARSLAGQVTLAVGCALSRRPALRSNQMRQAARKLAQRCNSA